MELQEVQAFKLTSCVLLVIIASVFLLHPIRPGCNWWTRHDPGNCLVVLAGVYLAFCCMSLIPLAHQNQVFASFGCFLKHHGYPCMELAYFSVTVAFLVGLTGEVVARTIDRSHNQAKLLDQQRSSTDSSRQTTTSLNMSSTRVYHTDVHTSLWQSNGGAEFSSQGEQTPMHHLRLDYQTLQVLFEAGPLGGAIVVICKAMGLFMQGLVVGGSVEVAWKLTAVVSITLLLTSWRVCYKRHASHGADCAEGDKEAITANVLAMILGVVVGDLSVQAHQESLASGLCASFGAGGGFLYVAAMKILPQELLAAMGDSLRLALRFLLLWLAFLLGAVLVWIL